MAEGAGVKTGSSLPGVSTESRPDVDELLDGMAEGFFALDSDWRFTAFNRAAEDTFDLRREDVIGRLLWEVSPTILGSEFERRYRKVMADRESRHSRASRPGLPPGGMRSARFRSATGSAFLSGTRPNARPCLNG